MNVWYDKDYYKHSPSNNPIGPKIGTEKVLRGTVAMGADNLMMADGFNMVVFKKLCHFLKLLKTGMMHYGNYI